MPHINLALKELHSANLAVIIERNSNAPPMMAVVLPNNLLRTQLPEARIVITRGRDQVRRVSAERAVPDPALVARQRALELEGDGDGGWFAAGNGEQLVEILDEPDFCGVVGGAGGQVLHVGTEEHARYVLAVGFEVGEWDQRGLFPILLEVPDEDVALKMSVRLTLIDMDNASA